MANPFQRDLKEGEIMRVKASSLRPQFHTVENRRVTIVGGYGASKDTQGSTVVVKFLCDGEIISLFSDELEEDKD